MATYTPAQMSRYFARIGWKHDWQPTPGSVAHLEELIKRQLAAVPFENLSLHYSQTHLLSLEPEDLFDKIVERKRGGYCMENNAFFGIVLRTLGYPLINAGARVSDATAGQPGGGFGGWSHMVNLVTVQGGRWLVDVGFGRNAPCCALPLISGNEMSGVGAQNLRLDYKRLPQHTDPAQRIWVYSTREHVGANWVEAYAFPELEFFAADFAIMNLSTMTPRRSIFLQMVTCVRLLLDEETKKPLGTVVLLQDRVKKTVRGEAEVVEELASEEDRIQALEKWFDIRLSENEQKGIRGCQQS